MKQRGFQLKEGLMLALWNRTPVLLKQEYNLAPRGLMLALWNRIPVLLKQEYNLAPRGTSFSILGLNRGILWRHQS